jgi:acetoin utilization deacetylase AcuC-like enzyme
MAVSEQGFAALARTLLGVADQVAGGRCVAVLEGGYDLRAIHASTEAVLGELRASARAPLPAPVSTSARPVLDAVRRRHADFWDF